MMFGFDDSHVCWWLETDMAGYLTRLMMRSKAEIGTWVLLVG
jgi:hypothetical protein